VLQNEPRWGPFDGRLQIARTQPDPGPRRLPAGMLTTGTLGISLRGLSPNATDMRAIPCCWRCSASAEYGWVLDLFTSSEKVDLKMHLSRGHHGLIGATFPSLKANETDSRELVQRPQKILRGPVG
jgi:hypothetical protein